MFNDQVGTGCAQPAMQALVGLQALQGGARAGRGASPFLGLAEEGPSGLKIQAAGDLRQRRMAQALVGQRYAQRGYLRSETAVEAEPQHLLTLRAVAEQRMLGTLGIRFDSELGLNADLVFGAEMAALRASGQSLCEFTQLALDVDVPSKQVLAALFHTAYIHAHRVHGAQQLVIEVNPRHVAYYRRMLGFQVGSESRLNPRVQAPAVLMSLDFAHVETQVERYGGKPAMGAVARTLYPFFFSPAEEAAIVAELLPVAGQA